MECILFYLIFNIKKELVLVNLLLIILFILDGCNFFLLIGIIIILWLIIIIYLISRLFC